MAFASHKIIISFLRFLLNVIFLILTKISVLMVNDESKN